MRHAGCGSGPRPARVTWGVRSNNLASRTLFDKQVLRRPRFLAHYSDLGQLFRAIVVVDRGVNSMQAGSLGQRHQAPADGRPPGVSGRIWCTSALLCRPSGAGRLHSSAPSGGSQTRPLSRSLSTELSGTNNCQPPGVSDSISSASMAAMTVPSTSAVPAVRICRRMLGQ